MGKTHGETDMMKIIIAFHNVKKAHKNEIGLFNTFCAHELCISALKLWVIRFCET